MGRGILTGLVWGIIVGLGIVTIANQIVEPVDLASKPVVQETASTPAADPVDVDTQTAPQEMPQDTQNTDSAPEIAFGDISAPNETSVVDKAPAVSTGPDADTKAQSPNLGEIDGDQDRPDPQTQPAAKPDASTPPQQQTPQVGALDAPNIPTTSADATILQGQDLSTPSIDSAPTVETDTPPASSLFKPVEPLPMQPAAPDNPEQTSQEQTGIVQAEPEPQDAAPEGPSMPGIRVGSFTDRDDPMKSTRIPSIGGTSQAAQEAPIVVAEDLPALLAYSTDFTPKRNGPKMSVILVDIGVIEPDAAMLSNLPFPVTFAVDALAPGASGRAVMYREAGLEVLSLIGLPDGATAQDVAVTIEQARELVPVAIGFLDVPTASFQSSREIAAQVIASANTSGHGVVSFASGLNALMQEATRAKHPAALVLRDIDGLGQTGSSIKRFLDQAAFRAGIDEDIVLVGRAQESTLAALAEWSLGNRAATVEMVPLSLLLQDGQTASGNQAEQ